MILASALTVTSLKEHRRRRRRGVLRRLPVTAAMCVWAGILPPGLDAATAQEPPREPGKAAVVTAITSEITVDGLLEEEIWRTAPSIGELTQREPMTGESPTDRTTVTLLYDADNLYIGVMCNDAEPERVIGTQMARDATLTSDDRIEILLDTYRDQRNAFYFATNPAGALVDGLVFANGQSNLQWDAIWMVRTRRTIQGWSAEFAIPFKSLGFPSGPTVWGFNIGRHILRKLEEDRWSGARIETAFDQVSEAGDITNLTGLTQGIGLDVRPFAGGHWLHTLADGRHAVTGKPGLDMFYNFTPSLKLTATVNTDFGETEVDARQINLSRFSLFFPEKRSFFLEDAGVFSFSNTHTEILNVAPARSQVIPFFSRQIGLLAGEEVPIDLGVKLTGKVGRTDLGVLDVRTRDVSNLPEKNFFVGRVKRNLLQQSYVGAIFTQGHPSLSIASRTFGADLRLATSNVLGKSKNLGFNVYGLRSMNAGRSGKDGSYGVSLEYPNEVVQVEAVWRDIQQNFRPAQGFVSRRNVRLLRSGARYIPRPKSILNLQRVFYDAFYTRFTRLDTGQVESWDAYFAVIDWHFNSGDTVHPFNTKILYEQLFAPFEIYPGVVLPPGEYRSTRWRLQTSTAPKRKLNATVDWWFGSYWSGHADELHTVLQFKIPPRIVLHLDTNQTFARLPQGNFVTRILSLQASYAASPFLSLSNLLQYDNRTRNLGLQSRVRWILQPGQDLFFVLAQGWIEDDLRGFRFAVQDTKVSAKVQYTARF